ncbi:hypothetical protein BDQ12DRAFT_604733 [Crucibulum laeve]|uniref:Uncharacterized protein n=1 Tax=Crucibulum laeve TaxID=68775 RepID=A0A5C3M1K3_9AGAR|nr:hypothetical protein BDQ12DRAFT_604733 [Crucibulum laeve]
MSSADRGYTTLLTHLHNPTSPLPFTTIQGALAHHLANLSPLPTPLAATAVSSPLYLSLPLTHIKLQSLSIAFRHASHLKYRALIEAEKNQSQVASLFRKSTQAAMGQWANEVVKGVQGGHPVLRLACCTGLLLGVHDLKVVGKTGEEEGVDLGKPREGVEDEVVVALAEVMDIYAYAYLSVPTSFGAEEWEKEFQPAGQDILSLALILASQSLPLVVRDKLKVLPLPMLTRALTTTISSTFKSGAFLSDLQASLKSKDNKICIPSSSPMSQTLQSISSSPLMSSIASLSKLTATVLSLMLDTSSPTRVDEGMHTTSLTLETFREMSRQVETDWASTQLARASEDDISPDSKDLTKSIWTTLKTLLFSNIMLADAVLSTVVFIPPLSPPHSHVTPSTLALQVLRTLSHLSFVISQFGGVTTTSQGFEALKKTFYLALDILAQGDSDSGVSGAKANAYVRESCLSLKAEGSRVAPSVQEAKQVYVLVSIEQLVPALSEESIKQWVWGLCYSHLSDPTHRETYESAHSVVLAIFASHAQQHQQQRADRRLLSGTDTVDSQDEDGSNHNTGGHTATNSPGRGDKAAGKEVSSGKELGSSTNFVKRMVPFYAHCLVENSVDGKLSTNQLRLAYSALVRSASASAYMLDVPPDETYTLAWYCIEVLLDTIRELLSMRQSSGNSKGKAKLLEHEGKTEERLHRLHLMLISTIPSLPLPLMLHALEEIRTVIAAYPQVDSGVVIEGAEEEGNKKELVESLFKEILERVGDREKEAAIQWWYKYRPILSKDGANDIKTTGSVNSVVGHLKGLGKQKTEVPEPRL